METQEKDSLPLFGDGKQSDPPRTEPEGVEPSPQELPVLEDEIIEQEPVAQKPRNPLPCRQATPEDAPGAYLRELRIRTNRTIQEIAEETKIRADYLEWLEAEDYTHLPQPVYVLGYIRKLCNLYGLDRDQADLLTAGLREKLEYELPEDLTKITIDREINEEDTRKTRQLMLLLIGGAVLVVVILVTAGILLLAGLGSRSTGTGPGGTFEAETLLRLQDSPKLETTELK